MEWYNVLEMIGIVAFALVGVFVGIEYELDLFGIFVVAVCSALGGGVVRDIVLGVTPPVSFMRPDFVIAILATVVVSLVLFKVFDKRFNRKSVLLLKRSVDIVDAVGLGVFTISGCQAAVANGFSENFILMVFVGTVTAIGGGLLRDLLSGRKPIVLRRELYALISIAGCTLYYFIYDKINIVLATYLTAGIVMAVRIIASWGRLNVRYSLKNEELKRDD